jgi:hypothetical protein
MTGTLLPATEAAPTIEGPQAAEGRRRVGRGELAALAVLVVVPVLAFAVPAMLGHSVLPGDDASQNFPMRVLVGKQLAAGHLPLLDLRIWSGTPLLAGWNAGAAYPFTWLFAVLPGTAAWAVNLMVMGWAAGLGLYAFLRANRLGPLAAVLGASVFAFSGAMDAQVVHFGLVAGVSWVPLQLLGVLLLDRATTRRAWCGAAALVAVSAALTLLAGEPRAIDVAAAVSGPYVLWRLWRRRHEPRAALRLLAGVVLAGVVAGCLGAVQLLPGLHAVRQSQRASKTFNLFDSGSYPLSWLLLLLVPNLLGGSGSFGAPSFFASYNLTEVTGYVGLLPLVAAVALWGRVRRGRPWPEWVAFEWIAALGVLLALGGSTPAWHLLIRIPLYGGQRLQSRNILVADLALAVLLAFWVDGFLRRRQVVDGARRARPAERWLAALAGLGALSVPALALTDTRPLEHVLGVVHKGGLALQLRPWFLPSLGVALGVLALVVLGDRLPRWWRAGATAALVTADVALFALTSLFLVAPASGPVGPLGAAAAADVPVGPTVPVADLGVPGRFAVYDPGLLDGAEAQQAGAPDANLLVGGWSLQGYSAIVNGTYAAATGSHGAMGAGQDVLSVQAVADGVLDQLDPSVLITPPQYLVVAAARAKALTAEGASQAPVPAAGQRDLTAGGTVAWDLGEPVGVTAVDLPVTVSRAGTLQLGLERASGQVDWLPAASLVPGSQTLAETVGGVPGTGSGGQDGPGARTVAILARGTAEGRTGVPEVRDAAHVPLDLDGALQAVLSASGQWRYLRQDGPFAVFQATHPDPPVRLVALPGRSLAGAAITGTSGPALAPWTVSVRSTQGAVLIRSVAAIEGWHVTWQPADGGPARPLALERRGIVQAVQVPPGAGTVRFVFRQPGFATASLLGVLGLVALAGLGTLWLFPRRRRPGSEPVPGPTAR